MLLLNKTDLAADADRLVAMLRRLNPAALWDFVSRRLDSGEFGTVLRSKGFFALASRPGVTGLWSQAGTVARFEPQGVAETPHQELVFIGVDLAGDALLAALGDCLGDVATGPDPFPEWDPVHGH